MNNNFTLLQRVVLPNGERGKVIKIEPDNRYVVKVDKKYVRTIDDPMRRVAGCLLSVDKNVHQVKIDVYKTLIGCLETEFDYLNEFNVSQTDYAIARKEVRKIRHEFEKQIIKLQMAEAALSKKLSNQGF